MNLEHFDPQAYVSAKGLSYSTDGPNVTAGWTNVNCPWCGDTSDHLGISPTGGISCWRCKVSGTVLKLIMKLDRCNQDEARAIIRRYRIIGSPDVANEHEHVEVITAMPKQSVPLWGRHCGVLPSLARKFLLQRGFAPVTEHCVRWRLSWGGASGRFRYRLLLPIIQRGVLVNFTSRAISNDMKLPYVNLGDDKASIPVKETLYNLDSVADGGRVVVVEGPLDVWKLGPGAVCTYGVGYTKAQVGLLRDCAPSCVHILYDNEPDAQDAAEKLANEIWFCETDVLQLEGVNDPGELTLEQGTKLMTELGFTR